MDPILLQAQQALLAGKVPGHVAAQILGLDVGSVHVDRPLTNMIAGYKNREYIADLCMPVVTVANRANKYFQFSPSEMLSVMQTQLDGQRGMPHEISAQVAADGNYSVKDHALIYFVSADEQTNADPPLRPLEVGNRKLHNALALARELRVAAKVFAGGSYPGATSALAGGDRWDQATSDPVDAIFTAIKSCLVRPTHLIIGEQVETKLLNHPKILQLILGRATTAGGAVPLYPNLDLLAKAFGLEGAMVGRAKYATQVEGQAFANGYVWGKSAALVRIEPQPSIEMTSTFGYTFRFGSWETRQIPEYLHGVRGGTFLKQSHSDDERVVGAQYTGYLYTTVVS